MNSVQVGSIGGLEWHINDVLAAVHGQRHIQRRSLSNSQLNPGLNMLFKSFVSHVQRRAFDLGVTDPMACGMALRIGDIHDLLAKIKSSGGRVLSKDEALVEWRHRP